MICCVFLCVVGVYKHVGVFSCMLTSPPLILLFLYEVLSKSVSVGLSRREAGVGRWSVGQCRDPRATADFCLLSGFHCPHLPPIPVGYKPASSDLTASFPLTCKDQLQGRYVKYGSCTQQVSSKFCKEQNLILECLPHGDAGLHVTCVGQCAPWQRPALCPGQSPCPAVSPLLRTGAEQDAEPPGCRAPPLPGPRLGQPVLLRAAGPLPGPRVGRHAGRKSTGAHAAEQLSGQ